MSWWSTAWFHFETWSWVFGIANEVLMTPITVLTIFNMLLKVSSTRSSRSSLMPPTSIWNGLPLDKTLSNETSIPKRFRKRWNYFLKCLWLFKQISSRLGVCDSSSCISTRTSMAVQAHRNTKGDLSRNEHALPSPRSSEGDKSSSFFCTESRILPPGFLKEQSKGVRVKDLVGRGTWFFITFKARLSVDNVCAVAHMCGWI